MSFRPPPGWIMAARKEMSIMVEKSPGLSKLKKPAINGFENPLVLNIKILTACFHQLAHYFVSDLVAPGVDHRHVDVVDKDGQRFASRRAVSCTNTFVHIRFNDSLK